MRSQDKPRNEKNDGKWVPMKEETEGKKLFNSIVSVVAVLGLGLGICLFYSFFTLVVLTLGRMCGCASE